MGDELAGDIAARPRTIIDDEGLAEQAGELVGDDARKNIAGAAGRKADHDRDRPVRIVGGPDRDARAQEHEQPGQRGVQPLEHDRTPLLRPDLKPRTAVLASSGPARHACSFADDTPAALGLNASARSGEKNADANGSRISALA